ncbi:TPA: hypothetical protein DD449_03250 [Candidatus Berkelbacteria bacterium]|uniref:Uncharacterized protein n=1 Tax=Berkelbacteria bacterium GW2011_GWE1_39_12 TaxID=1618337 RepID=A0A0G4B2B1_9BACT|nr:MAG: hypothetical protein UT28_C0001G0280 [Berkelbacteria bacterium GW2011_GWE1_39_12]HBO60675.1 hypothetical protein [Candidatus Berkelbacteria bacterium]
MKRLVVLLLSAVVLVVIVGCSSPRSKYVGNWQIPGGGEIALYKDGTGFQGAPGHGDKVEWHAEGDHIVMSMAGGRDPVKAKLSPSGKLVVQDGTMRIEMQRK